MSACGWLRDGACPRDAAAVVVVPCWWGMDSRLVCSHHTPDALGSGHQIVRRFPPSLADLVKDRR